MKNYSQLQIEARTENLSVVLSFVASKISGIDKKFLNHIEMAVEEVFINISKYAYNPATGPVYVFVTVDNDAVHIEFRDGGVPYNPLLKDDPDITLTSDKRMAGGHGIYIIKTFMDNVEYRRDGNVNILKITKEMV